jgi:hemolysin III
MCQFCRKPASGHSDAVNGIVLTMVIQKNELFNSLTHCAGAVASVILTIVFYIISIEHDGRLALAVCITALSYVFLFASSSIYHANKIEEDEQSLWLKLDHCAIFIMIAGSYVGPLYIYAPGGIRWAVLGAVWLFALLGIVLKLRYLISPNWVNVAIYAPLCVMSLVPMALLWESVDSIPLGGVPISFLKALLVAGLVTYAVGGIVYALKQPDPKPGVIGFHGVFHVFILVGAGLHAMALYYSIRAYPVIREFQRVASCLM